MNNTIKQLAKMDGLLAGDGVSDDAIREAEKVLVVKFAEDYRSYLSSYGIVAVNGHELTGLGASSRVDVVAVTEEVRKRLKESLNELYVIENDNIDGIIYWQNRAGKVYRTVNDSEPKLIADSLIEFINL